MSDSIEDILPLLLARFDGAGVAALVLMGSHARGDAGPYSDVDLVRFLVPEAAPPGGVGSHLVDGLLVVVGNVLPAQVEAWFTAPEQASATIAGLHSAHALLDRGGSFAAIQARARGFVWDEAMQRRANEWASEQMVGWIEEVHKGLEGLRRDDPGRLLNARFGCSWGLSHIVQVQRGVLLAGDNGFFEQVEAAMADEPEWLRLRRCAFGMADGAGNSLALREQVMAGLRLYVLTARLLEKALTPTAAPLVAQTVARIAEALGGGDG